MCILRVTQVYDFVFNFVLLWESRKGQLSPLPQCCSPQLSHNTFMRSQLFPLQDVPLR